MDKLIRDFHNRLEDNYNTYKTEMLKNSPEEIYDAAHKIHFTDSIYDYLSQYEWDSSNEHLKRLVLLSHRRNIFESLWQVYTDVEWLGYQSFEEIDDLMGAFYRQNKIE